MYPAWKALLGKYLGTLKLIDIKAEGDEVEKAIVGLSINCKEKISAQVILIFMNGLSA